MEINGVAHTFITAGDFASARAFYGQLLPFLGLAVVADTVNTFYCIGPHRLRHPCASSRVCRPAISPGVGWIAPSLLSRA